MFGLDIFNKCKKNCDNWAWRFNTTIWKRTYCTIQLQKQRIEKVISWEWVNWFWKNVSEILMLWNWRTSTFLKEINSINWCLWFDLSIIYTLLSTIKKNVINTEIKSYTVNIHMDTILNPLFLHYLKEIKNKTWVYKLDFLYFEILETQWKKKVISNENIDKLTEKIYKLQQEWIKVWLDDYDNWLNNEILLVTLRKKLSLKKSDIDFVKIDRKYLSNLEDLDKLKIHIKIIKEWNPNWTLVIVIEWIESEEMLNELKKIKWIDGIQWFLISWKSNITSKNIWKKTNFWNDRIRISELKKVRF